MNFYDELTDMDWTKISQSDFIYDVSDENMLIDYIIKNTSFNKKNIFELRFPESVKAKAISFLIIHNNNMQFCLAVPGYKVFTGTVEYDLDLFLGNIIRKCTSFLKKCDEVQKPCIISDETKLPDEYYHDYWCANYNKYHFRLNNADGLSVILAFPSADNGVWSSILTKNKENNIVQMVAKQNYLHFMQSINVFLNQIIFCDFI